MINNEKITIEVTPTDVQNVISVLRRVRGISSIHHGKEVFPPEKLMDHYIDPSLINQNHGI